MMFSISTLFGDRRAKRTAAAQLRMSQAYKNLFSGNGDSTDAEIVLVDLARFSGYYHTTEPQASDAVLRHREGQRSVLGHALSWINLPPETQDKLVEAVRREDNVSKDEGMEL